jgi:hypothetical protein
VGGYAGWALPTSAEWVDAHSSGRLPFPMPSAAGEPSAISTDAFHPDHLKPVKMAVRPAAELPQETLEIEETLAKWQVDGRMCHEGAVLLANTRHPGLPQQELDELSATIKVKQGAQEQEQPTGASSLGEVAATEFLSAPEPLPTHEGVTADVPPGPQPGQRTPP